jgi:outer membrane lipoprotein-sorting protein
MTSMRLVTRALAVLAVATDLYARSASLDATEILRRAEEVRSPDLDYAVDFTLEVVSPDSAWKQRRAAYSMIAHGKNQSLVLMREPKSFYSGSLLIQDGSYWLLLPQAGVPFQLSPRNVLEGDVANGDLARGNLLDDYAPRLLASDRFRGEECYVLELLRAKPRALSPRIVCWVSRKRFLPRRFDYYGETGQLLRVAYYEDYRQGPVGLRSMRIVVDDQVHPGERTTMTFSDLRRFDVSRFKFTLEGLIAFRDAAKAKLEAGDGATRLENLAAE